MYYPDSIVDEVRSRNDIVSVIGSYITLHKSSSNFVGLCPFHNEKTPSFNVNPARQIFHCFGCHKGGNVFTFVMEYENVSFPEALRILADRVGYKLPERDDSEAARVNRSKKERMMALYKEAAEYYFRKLRSDEGRHGLEYLAGRALQAKTMRDFGLGFSDGTLYSAVKDRYDDPFLAESGLFTFRENGGVGDKFFNRVMFPIFDQNGKVIAFGGRVMGDAKPKYLNSPESLIFDKSRNLYNLNTARRSRRPYFILCEGYMDVIALVQAGFDCAIATLGTALTEQQAKLISRYRTEVVLTYDSDEAGQKAINRAIPMLYEVGVHARIVDMRPYKDPDEFLRDLGAAEYEKRIEKASASFEFEIRYIADRYRKEDLDPRYKNWMEDPSKKSRFSKEIAHWMLRFKDRVERSEYSKAFCREYDINLDDFRADLNAAIQNARSTPKPEAPPAPPKERVNGDGEVVTVTGASKPAEEGILQAQNVLLSILAAHPAARATVRQYVKPDNLTGKVYREVMARCYEAPPDRVIDAAELSSRYETVEEQRLVAEMLAATEADRIETEQIRRAVADTVVKIMTQYYRDERERAERAGDSRAVMDAVRKAAEVKNWKIKLMRERY
ncbi:MAG: DNA primase [Lachnospiraceae bacterium]|nr:DNA primase [Lachnospiraceae bacterium]